jgi:hypothetical protein
MTAVPRERIINMIPASPLAQALRNPGPNREAVIEAIMIAVDTTLANIDDEPTVDQVIDGVGEVFQELSINNGGGPYALARDLCEDRRMIHALESGADPRWFVDQFYGDVDTLRRDLLERAQNDWNYSIAHLTID